MLLFKSASKTDINTTVFDAVIREYFKVLRELNVALNTQEVSELLRYSVCRALGLQSLGTTTKLQILSDKVYVRLINPLKEQGVYEKSIEYKQGVLEACVHCMEMTRRSVDERG